MFWTIFFYMIIVFGLGAVVGWTLRGAITTYKKIKRQEDHLQRIQGLEDRHSRISER